EIVVSPHATMGDAAPIQYSPLTGIVSLGQTERSKILSPLLAEIVDSARQNGYDEKLVQALVSLGVELWMIEDKETGRRYCIDEAEYREIFGHAPSRGAPLIASGTTGVISNSPVPELPLPATDATQAPVGAEENGSGPAAPFQPASGAIDRNTIGEVDQALTAPSSRPMFSARDADRYKLVGYVTDGQALLTMKEREIKFLGFAHTTIKDDQELKDYTGAQHLRRLDQNWSEYLVEYMTQGGSGLVIRGLLIFVFLLAMFIELSVPGVGIAGVVALVALGGLIVPPMLIGAANWWAGASIIGGLVLIVLEIFVLPGVAVAGVIGVGLLLVGLIGLFAETGALFPGQKSGDRGDLAWAGSIVMLAVFVSGVGMYLFSKYTHRFPLAGRLVLADRQPTGDSIGLLEAMGPAKSEGPVKIGATGRTVTPLRPAGTADIDGKLIDVVAEFGFVGAGEPIRVVNVTPYRVGVELHRLDDAGSPKGDSKA
ncbi:MAG TPA: hypothetical protein VG797_03995, partial [Phycisphaerales bacterium]|nr:hypothetical protein [Phycisphaerales bacterium]